MRIVLKDLSIDPVNLLKNDFLPRTQETLRPAPIVDYCFILGRALSCAAIIVVNFRRYSAAELIFLQWYPRTE